MPVTDGALPKDIYGNVAGSGYSPNVGTVPLQLGSPTNDSQGQPSAPLVIQSTVTGPSSSPNVATVNAPGELRVSLEPTQLFFDAFDTGLDTVNKWKSPTSVGGGVAATNTLTYTAIGSGTTANGYSYLESLVTFPPVAPGWLEFSYANNFEYPLIANVYRFWGIGTSPATPTAALPLTDAVGWEMTTAGKLMAVTYQGGTRFQIADLSVTTGTGKQFLNANPNTYAIFFRGDMIFWALGSPDNIVASTSNGAPGPNVNSLPLKVTAIAGSIAPLSSATVTVNGVWIADTTRASTQLSDGVYPFRKATITALHNSDNQALPIVPASYGLLTGGVAQLINPLGNLDRQREAGQDQLSPLGVSLGATAFAQSFSTTVPTTGTLTTGAATGTITPLTMTGIQVGAILTVDTGANTEVVVVTALPTTSTATVVPTNGSPAAPAFLHTHTPSYGVTGFMLNQERDASGENSGASGKGTAVAAEYEYTSGGPILSTGLPSLLQYDREVAALGKVAVNAGAGYAITSTTSGNAILTPTTPSQFATLTPGQWIRLSGSGTNEYVRVADTYIIAATPATIPLTSPVVSTGQTLATWDAFGANGPGQNPVLWTGEGFEGVLLNDRANAGFARALQGNTAGEASMTVGGLQTTQVTPTSLTVIKATPGRLGRVLCSTANATNAINIYDNASTGAGTIIGVIPITATIGQVFDLQMPALLGITIAATASAGTITVSYS
jgi:hypothetical protein